MAHLLYCCFTFEQMCRTEKLGGCVCVLSVQDNREATTAHIFQDRNLRCHWNALWEKKETCHPVALLERCSRTYTHGRWRARTKGVVLGFLRTTGVNGSPQTEVKEEYPPPTSNTAIRARVLLRTPLNFQMPQIHTFTELWELKSKKNPHLLHCLFLSGVKGAFIICINLGFNTTWPQWNWHQRPTEHTVCCSQSTPSITSNT